MSLNSTCNVREHSVSGADVSCSVSLAGNEYRHSKLFCVHVIGSEVYLETHRFSRNHYRLVTTTVNMEWFTHAEMADMQLVYGSVNGNGRAPVREY